MNVVDPERSPVQDLSKASKANSFAALRGKRILLATESLGPINGVSRTTLSLVEYLRRNGVDVAVIAPEIAEQELKSGRSASANIRLRGHPLPYNPDLKVVHPFRYDRVCARTLRPALVYLASPASVGFQFLLQIRQLREPPVVVCNFQTDLSAYSAIMFPPLMDRFAMWLLGAVQGFLFKHQSVYRVFYPSKCIGEYLVNIGAPKCKLSWLGRGVDTVAFHPSRRDEAYRKLLAPNREIILVCVCRLAPEKGLEFLARVAVKLVEQLFPFKLLIVGGNRNPAVEDEIKRYFEPVKTHVIFQGFLSGAPLARAYASADIFLHCSVTETFGLVVLEAMASGVSVVARDQGGPSDIVRHGKTGFLVPASDLDAFVGKILVLCNNLTLRAEMAAAARLQAEDTTWDKINQHVACTMVDAIEWHAQRETVRKYRRPFRNWLCGKYDDMKLLVVPLMELLRLHAAVGVVCFFWLMAVLPLLIHGHSLFGMQGNALRISQAWLRQVFGRVQRKH